MVIQKARDESHRFSITANKTASLDEIKNIKLEEIEKICTKKQIEILKDHGIY